MIAATASIFSSVFLLQQSIRLDEAQTIWVATKSYTMMLELIAQDVHVPLYHSIIHFWMRVFGTGIVGVRLVSLFFFFITVPLFFKLTRQVSEDSHAWYALSFFIVSPFILWYSNEARMYSLFALVTTVHHLAFLNFLKNRGSRAKLNLFFTTLFGIYTHYFFWLVIFSQGLFLFMKSIKKFRRKQRDSIVFGVQRFFQQSRILFIYLRIILLATLFFLPWIGFVVYLGAASNSQPLIDTPTSYNLLQVFTQFIFGIQSSSIMSSIISLWPLTVALVFFFFTKRRSVPLKFSEYFMLSSFFPILAVFVVSFVRPIFLSRYLILVTPTFFIFFSWIIMNAAKSRYVPGVIGLLLLVMTGSTLVQNMSPFTPVKENYQQVAAYLSKEATSQDIIAVSAPFTVYPIEYGYKGQSRIDTIPHWNRFVTSTIPVFTLEGFQQQMKDYQQQYRKIFVVLSYDQGYEDEIRKLLDKGYGYEKHVKFSEGLEVRQYVLRYDLMVSDDSKSQ